MHLPDEQDETGFSKPVLYTILTVSVLILIILVCVLAGNSKKPSHSYLKGAGALTSPTMEAEVMEFPEDQKEIEQLYNENKLRSEDLDFWDMYEKDEPVVEEEPAVSPSPTPSHEPTEEEMAADGNHVQVFYLDGTSKWLAIEDTLPRHTYDFTNMKATNGQMVYYEGNKKLSRLGVRLSEENGDVDFEALKEAGVNFVMLKVGGRGYESGLITLDEAFVTNAQKAQEAGLKIGAYFVSQAVTVEEAVQEAEFVANQLIPYTITYPVALQMDSVSHDFARTDTLDIEKKTQMAETFLREIEKAGHQGILYADKNWLLTEVLYVELLKEYEVWLDEQSPVPDFPYQFQMWEYTGAESVNGVNGDVSYTISFVDYTKR